MRPIGKPYTHSFEPQMLDIWFRHHLRCWWIRSRRYAYSEYAKHVGLTEQTIKDMARRKIHLMPQVLEDMNCVRNLADGKYQITIQRYTDIDLSEGVEDE